MSQPTPYSPSTDFSEEETNAVGGRSTVRTARVDAEFDNLATTIGQLLTNLAIIQRDDTALNDGIVDIHTLSAGVLALLSAAGVVVKGAWLTATVYAAKDIVTQAGSTYICAVAHTSGVFATDLAAVKWVLIANSPSAFSAASVSFTPAGGVAAANVQAAIAEVDTEALKKASNLSDVVAPATAIANIGGLPVAGGTMAGALVLSGAPTVDLHAATKAYTDDIINGLLTGQCYFTVTSTTQAKLSRLNGNKLFINGEWYSIPALGVTVSNSGLSTSTTYYVYAYQNVGTITLEISTTAYADDATYGNKIKSGDATRVLVGMVRTQSGSAIFETADTLYLSWFNKKGKVNATAFSVDRTTTSTATVEINSEIRTPFLTWTGEVVRLSSSGHCSNSGANVCRTFIGIDGTTGRANGTNMLGTSAVPIAVSEAPSSLAEGYHYATLCGSVGAGTGTWAASSIYGCRITVEVNG
jgi:hypothetical protein